ncbi:hypothetical protein M0R72_21325 [Candidatus Pacearchaeota archaeon]|jgi:hypothetical protein|nr:hypothetical protein [Candidatus Pacearchaeota archaeon]
MNLTIFNNPSRRGYELHIDRQESDKVLVASKIDFLEANFYEFMSPVAMLTAQECVDLMDSLWKSGIRPSDGEGSVGQIGAVTRHLEDMRQIVSSKLNIPLEAVK